VVVILGSLRDMCCTLVRQELIARNEQILFLAEESLYQCSNTTFEMGRATASNSFHLIGEVSLSANASGLIRPSNALYEILPPADAAYIVSEWAALIRASMYSLPGRVINRLRPELWYQYALKPPQIVVHAPVLTGITARFLITNRSEDAKSFVADLADGAVISPLTGIAEWPVTASDGRQLSDLAGTLPLLIVERGLRRSAHVIIVGDQAIVVPPGAEVTAETLALCASAACQLGISFARFEIAKTSAGRTILKSIHVMPDVGPYDLSTRRRIVSALVDCLLSPINLDHPQPTRVLD
jgi:hypothetical protein